MSSCRQDLAHRLKLPIGAYIFAAAGEDKTFLIWHGLFNEKLIPSSASLFPYTQRRSCSSVR